MKDSSIPMWVLKFKGETHYVNHVDFDAPCSTKETLDNEHTKGSIKFKNVKLIISDGCATISRGSDRLS